ncbi:hypothetical protein M405DRAFT_433660 [Rhizopogon salebrosus TDB-379]|nr:hypothetical protein M405DRAFT_433660 [Rhizopogon salebrosus TDB-379]
MHIICAYAKDATQALWACWRSALWPRHVIQQLFVRGLRDAFTSKMISIHSVAKCSCLVFGSLAESLVLTCTPTVVHRSCAFFFSTRDVVTIMHDVASNCVGRPTSEIGVVQDLNRTGA